MNMGSFSVKRVERIEFLKCIVENFFCQCVASPTREGTVLDLVLGNEAGRVEGVAVGEH